MSSLGRHKSLDKDAKRSINWLKDLEHVTKVVLGFSECCRHKFPPGSLRVKSEVDGGLKLNAYSGKGVTDVFVRINPISERDSVIKQIKEKFPV